MKKSLFQAFIIMVVSIIVAVSVNAFHPGAIPFFAKEIKTVNSHIELIENDETALIQYISLEIARSLYDEGILFVDARDIAYYNEGHIPGALSNENFMKLLFTIDSLQTRTDIVITYCNGDDCGSSEDLAYDLLDSGFSNVMVFVDGWSEWVNVGYEVEK
ncbi:MAG: rhodanese-like domain-containing protein [Candidatus Marinimicrobia bacterium]|nr:rhodanese-like domain-containing protein [Candidatus Neomarinimicrobiota bacterium]MBL7059533.1 rhodanese-like domain-containing protein [Candidatus Neomarinimicrobiota bacterium]